MANEVKTIRYKIKQYESIEKSVLNDADAGDYEGVVHTEGSGNYVKHTLSCEFHVPDVQ